MSALVTPPPLLFDLTVPPRKPSAALYLSEYLVRLIGSEVTTFRRNALASYHFVDITHRVVGELQKLVDEVLTKGTIQSFFTWTKALTPLERLLLDFDPKDFTGSNKLVEVSDRLACKADLEKWKETRKKTHEKLQALHDQDELRALEAVPNQTESLKDVYQRDDEAFLNELVSEIKMRAIPEDSNPPEHFKNLLKDVAVQTSEIAGLFGRKAVFTSEPQILVVVQSTMAIYGWSHFATKLGVDAKTKEHMWSEPVCSSAKKLLEGLKDLGANPSEEKTNEAQALYQAFINLAFGTPSLSCVNLMKLLSDIGRAYYAQALALITLCDEAVKHCNDDESRDDKKVTEIEAALNQTSTALTAAAKTANESVGTLDLPQWTMYKEGDAYDKDPRSTDFRNTLNHLVATFAKIPGVTEAAVAQGTKKFDDAVVEDKDLTAQANKRMNDITNPPKVVQVTVEVKQGASSVLKPRTVQVVSSTLVSAIERGISGIPEVDQVLAGKFVHFKSDETIIAKDKTIGDLLGLKETLDLVMVITDTQMSPMNGVTSHSTSNDPSKPPGTG
ncbi:hypothetical protein FRC09_004887 [Ceratobasidium sp. 395]|nr:hypothetical protein FRC09_004887 [Ceratobasidium sp. 395]